MSRVFSIKWIVAALVVISLISNPMLVYAQTTEGGPASGTTAETVGGGPEATSGLPAPAIAGIVGGVMLLGVGAILLASSDDDDGSTTTTTAHH